MKALGVDYGERRIGLAVAAEDVGVALPLRTVAGGREAVRAVAEAAREEAIDEIVVGLPLRLDGSEGVAARRARRFGEALAQATGCPVRYWDERLTTVAAERALSEMRVRGKDRRSVVDQGAATLMLQGFMDARKRVGGEERWLEDEGPEGDGDPGADRGPWHSHGR